MGEREYRDNQPERSRYNYGRENSSNNYVDRRNPDFSYVNTELTEEELEEDDVIAFAALNPESETTPPSQEQVAFNYLDAGWGEIANPDNISNDNYNSIDTSNWKTPDGRDLSPEEKQRIASVYQGSTIPGFVIASYGTLGSRTLWQAFGKIVARRFGERAAFAAMINAGDPISPVAELLTIGLAALTIYQIYRTWDELWGETEAELGNPNSEIVVTEEPDNQIYTTPNGEQQTVEHTGSAPPQVETGTPPFDTEAEREIAEGQQHTGNTTQQEVDWDNYIFESRRRNVQGHDDAGGHTDERHIGKSDSWLQKRAATLPPQYEASSFTDTSSANLTQARAVKENRAKIDAYIKSKNNKNLVLNVNMNREIGRVVNRSGKAWNTKKAKVVINRDASELGYKILTSYPVK